MPNWKRLIGRGKGKTSPDTALPPKDESPSANPTPTAGGSAGALNDNDPVPVPLTAITASDPATSVTPAPSANTTASTNAAASKNPPEASVAPVAAVVDNLKIKANGLTVISRGKPESFDVDICLIHGLNGNAQRTWTHPKTKFFWPLELANAIPKARVMVFGYDSLIQRNVGSNQIRLRSIARSLLQELIDERSDETETLRPLLLLGHSLGGLVMKMALIQAEQRPEMGRAEIYQSTKCLLFFGTPNAGSGVDKKKRIEIIKAIAKISFTEVPPKLEALLQQHSDELLDLADDFRNLEICKLHKLLIYSFHETLNFPGMSERIVDENSSRVHASLEEPLPVLSADHNSMVKFVDNDDITFVRISRIIQRVEKMPSKAETGSMSLAYMKKMISANMLLRDSTPADMSLMAEAGGNLDAAAPSVWSSASTVAGSKAIRRYYEVPRSLRINRFIGQNRTIQDIDSSFHSVLEGHAPLPTIVTLVGMGGIGKTQIALEYCERTRAGKKACFHDVFWFDASSEESMITGCIKVAAAIAPRSQQFANQSESIQFALCSLSSWTKPYLIVLDNFDDPEFENILDYVPTSGPGGVLITSRLRAAGEELGTMIEVPLMNEIDSLALLRSRKHLQEFTESQELDAKQVINVLGNLPLALDQAGAYMASGGVIMSFTAFLKQYDRKKAEIMSATPGFWKYKSIKNESVKSSNLSIFTTWTLSLERLGSDPTDRAKKTHFLTLMAFLDPNRISKVLFESHAKYRKQCPTCRTGNDWMEIFGSQEPKTSFDIETFRKVVIEMSNLSLIRHVTVDDAGDSLALSLHPLIRDWAKFRVTNSEQRQFSIEASFVLCNIAQAYEGEFGVIDLARMVSSKNTSEWDFAISLRQMIAEIIAHMDSCVSDWKRFEVQWYEVVEEDPETTVEYVFGMTYQATFLLDKSCEMLERLLFRRTKSLNRLESHDFYLNVEGAICRMRIEQGRGSEIRDRLTTLIQKRKTLSNPDGFVTMVLSLQLAQLYEGDGDITKAQGLALSIREPIKSMDIRRSVALAFVCVQFLNLLQRLNLHDEAEAINRFLMQHIGRRHQKPGDLPPSTSVRNLLEEKQVQLLLASKGNKPGKEQLAEAEILIEELKSRSVPSLNPVHDFTLKMYHAQVLAAQEKWQMAVDTAEVCHKYFTEALGPEHPIALKTGYYLSIFMLQAKHGNAERPARLLNDAFNSTRDITFQRTIASALYNSGHPSHALQFYEKVLARRAETSDSSSPKLRTAQNEVAVCLYKLPKRSKQDTDRAISLFREVLDKEFAVGDGHAEDTTEGRITIRWRLAMLLHAKEEWEKALVVYEEMTTISVAEYGEYHQQTWIIKVCMATCFRSLKKPEAARAILREVHAEQLTKLEPSHEDVQPTLIGMGHTYKMMDSAEQKSAYDSAKDCYQQVLLWRSRVHGRNSKEVAEAHRWLGELQEKRGLYPEAMESFSSAREWSRGERGEDYLSDIICIGNQLYLAGKHTELRPHLLERLECARRLHGNDSSAAMFALAALATNAENLQQLDDALRYRESELDLRQKLPGVTKDVLIISINHCARLNFQLRRLEKARLYVLKRLEITETDGHPDDISIAVVCNDLGNIERDLGNLPASVEQFRRALGVYQSTATEPNADYASVYVGLGCALFDLGEFAEAESQITAGWVMRRKVCGKDHNVTTRAEFWAARCKYQLEKYSEAKDLFERCLPKLRSATQPSPFWAEFWNKNVEVGEQNLEVCKEKLEVSKDDEQY